MLTANTFLCVTQVIMSEAIVVDSLLASCHTSMQDNVLDKLLSADASPMRLEGWL